MKRGVCVKCGARTVYAKESGISFDQGKKTSVIVKTGMVKSDSEAEAFICTSCGYYEIYVTDHKKLRDVEKKWRQVTPRS